MGALGYIIFSILVYRHASGKAKCNRFLLWSAYILTLGTVLPIAFWGYVNNPDHNKLSFKDVL